MLYPPQTPHNRLQIAAVTPLVAVLLAHAQNAAFHRVLDGSKRHDARAFFDNLVGQRGTTVRGAVTVHEPLSKLVAVHSRVYCGGTVDDGRQKGCGSGVGEGFDVGANPNAKRSPPTLTTETKRLERKNPLAKCTVTWEEVV